MAVHAFTLTDVQEEALTLHVSDLNVGRVAQGQAPFPSNDAYVAFRVVELLRPVLTGYNAAKLSEIAPLFEKADLTLREKIKAELEAAAR